MKLVGIEITEKVIAKANLLPGEERVIRVYVGLSCKGGRDEEWVNSLGGEKRQKLFQSAQERIKNLAERGVVQKG